MGSSTPQGDRRTRVFAHRRIAFRLILAKDLGYGETADLKAVLEEVSRMLNAYAAAILAPDF